MKKKLSAIDKWQRLTNDEIIFLRFILEFVKDNLKKNTDPNNPGSFILDLEANISLNTNSKIKLIKILNKLQ